MKRRCGFSSKLRATNFLLKPPNTNYIDKQLSLQRAHILHIRLIKLHFVYIVSVFSVYVTNQSVDGLAFPCRLNTSWILSFVYIHLVMFDAFESMFFQTRNQFIAYAVSYWWLLHVSSWKLHTCCLYPFLIQFFHQRFKLLNDKKTYAMKNARLLRNDA